jgi:hypothetical protein
VTVFVTTALFFFLDHRLLVMARRDEKGIRSMHAMLPEGLAEGLVHAAASGRLPEGPRRAQLPENPGQASV